MSSGALFLSSQQVAELLAIPVSTLRFWSWAGSGPEGFPAPIRVGGRLRYSKAALKAWIDAQAAVAQSEAHGA